MMSASAMYAMLDGSKITHVFTYPMDREPPAGAVLVPMGTDPSVSYYDVQAGSVARIPESPSQSHLFDYATKEWVDSRALSDLQESARAEINAWRDQQEAMGVLFEHAGRLWDCNAAAKDKLQATADMQDVPPGFFWTDASTPVNEDVPMGIADVRALNEAHKVAYFQRGLQIHVRQREMKAALEAMDRAELVAFIPGWPSDRIEEPT